MNLPDQIQEQLTENRILLDLFQSQVNKDLERSGFSVLQANNLEDFLLQLVETIDKAITDDYDKLMQLYYLADVRDKDVKEYGLTAGFVKREWDKVKFRYENDID